MRKTYIFLFAALSPAFLSLEAVASLVTLTPRDLLSTALKNNLDLKVSCLNIDRILPAIPAVFELNDPGKLSEALC